jgi:hypothetical protein
MPSSSRALISRVRVPPFSRGRVGDCLLTQFADLTTPGDAHYVDRDSRIFRSGAGIALAQLDNV